MDDDEHNAYDLTLTKNKGNDENIHKCFMNLYFDLKLTMLIFDVFYTIYCIIHLKKINYTTSFFVNHASTIIASVFNLPCASLTF